MNTYSVISMITYLVLLCLIRSTLLLTTVEEIKCLDKNITVLMDRAVTQEEVSRMQRFVTFYTGEMAGVVWQMVEPMQFQELWHVCKELHSHGKPDFIDKPFNKERFVRMFQWTLDDIQYFAALRDDANTVWEQFQHEYRERKNRRHHTRWFTTDPGIEEVTLP